LSRRFRRVIVGRIMLLFEVILEAGQGHVRLLSDETLADTGAQEMTPEQAEKAGFHGIPEDPHGRERRFIACKHSDQGRILNALEAHAAVAQFQLHEVG
jgi:hypothetical protein